MPNTNKWEESNGRDDKIHQVFKFLEIADITQWNGKNVFEAGDADTFWDIMRTAFNQVELEAYNRGRHEAIAEERERIVEMIDKMERDCVCSPLQTEICDIERTFRRTQLRIINLIRREATLTKLQGDDRGN